MANKLKCVMMCGLPASGKSTYLQTHLKSYVKVSQDEIRRIFYGNQFYKNAEPYVVGDAKNIVRMMLEQGKNVVIDATSISYQYRREWQAIAEEHHAEFSVIYLDVPSEVCLLRNRARPKEKRVPADVILRMARDFDIPNEYVNVKEPCPVKIIRQGK